MKAKLIMAIFGIVLAIALVAAAFYPEPFNTNIDMNDYNVSNANWVLADIFNGTSAYLTNIDVSGDVAISGNMTGDLNWTYLWNYPVACPSGAITQLGDSVTCTDSWVDVAGDNMTGNLNMNQNNITNISLIDINNDYDWISLNIDSEATTASSYGLYIDTAGAYPAYFATNAQNAIQIGSESAATGTFYIHRNWDSDTTAQAMIYVWNENTTDDQANLLLINAGTGPHITTGGTNEDLEIDPDGSGEVSVTGNVTINGDLNVTGSTFSDGSYGEMFINSSSAQSIATQNVWINMTGFKEGLTNGINYDSINLTMTSTDIYEVDFSGSFTAVKDKAFEASIGVGGVPVNKCTVSFESINGSETNMGGSCLASLAENDVVTMMVRNTDGTENPTFVHFNLNLVKIS